MKYVGWTFLMWVTVAVIADHIASAPAAWLSGGTIVGLVLVVGLPLYVIGLVVMLWWDNTHHWSSR